MENKISTIGRKDSMQEKKSSFCWFCFGDGLEGRREKEEENEMQFPSLCPLGYQ